MVGGGGYQHSYLIFVLDLIDLWSHYLLFLLFSPLRNGCRRRADCTVSELVGREREKERERERERGRETQGEGELFHVAHCYVFLVIILLNVYCILKIAGMDP